MNLKCVGNLFLGFWLGTGGVRAAETITEESYSRGAALVPYTTNTSGTNASGIYWSTPTNDINVGIILEYSTGTNRTEVAVFPVLSTKNTNNFDGIASMILRLPPPDQRYRMTLFDDQGRPVPKTEKGQALGKPLDTRPTKLGPGYQDCGLSPFEPPSVFAIPLLLRDYFVITKPGKYRLEFQLRALTGRRRVYTAYYFPVKVEIDINTRTHCCPK